MTTEQALVELRSLPGAPDRLRERVLALPEPGTRTWTLPRFQMRRMLLVAALAALAVTLGAAALNGVVAGRGGDSAALVTLEQRDKAAPSWESATITTPTLSSESG